MTAGADEVRQEKRQLEAERLQRACAADICEAMENAAARRVLLRILRYTGVVVHDVSTFDKNALVMAQNEGIQRVGRWLLSEISFSTPTGYLTILQENLEEERRLSAQENGEGHE